jgi:hypothetical protein
MHSPSSQFSPKNPTSGRAIHSNSSPAEKAGCGVSVTIPNAVHSRHYIYTIQFTHQKIHACLPLAGQSAARQAPLQHTISAAKKSAPIRLTRSIRVPFQHPHQKIRACLPPGRFIFTTPYQKIRANPPHPRPAPRGPRSNLPHITH